MLISIFIQRWRGEWRCSISSLWFYECAHKGLWMCVTHVFFFSAWHGYTAETDNSGVTPLRFATLTSHLPASKCGPVSWLLQNFGFLISSGDCCLFHTTWRTKGKEHVKMIGPYVETVLYGYSLNQLCPEKNTVSKAVIFNSSPETVLWLRKGWWVAVCVFRL